MNDAINSINENNDKYEQKIKEQNDDIEKLKKETMDNKKITKDILNDAGNHINLRNPNKNMALATLSIYYTWKKVKSTYNNNKFKISAPSWNETFHLPDGLCNIPEIQDYIEYIIKKHETIGENAPILFYTNTINNRIVFKIKSGYKLELLSKETMRLLGSTKDIIYAIKIVKTY